MISIQNVSKSYTAEKKAVDNLSLSIKSGEIFGLLGPNGAGKSTLLKMLVGILQPTEGSILLDNVNIQDDPLKAKQKLYFIDDSPDHLLRLKGHEFLRFVADIYQIPLDIREKRVTELAKSYGLEDQLDARLETYSHGMRQKMMVVAALLVNPDIWILDEPMTGLDPKASWILKQSMREHADAGKTVLFSTHVLDVAEKVVDRVGIINHGKLIFVGTIADMREHFKQNESLESMFLELTDSSSPFEDVQQEEN